MLIGQSKNFGFGFHLRYIGGIPTQQTHTIAKTGTRSKSAKVYYFGRMLFLGSIGWILPYITRMTVNLAYFRLGT